MSPTRAESVTVTNINNQYIKITLQTAADNGVVSNLIHYIMVKNGENNIHMATYAENAPAVGELRWITRLRTPKLPNGPTPTDLRGNIGTVESGDVFGMSDGTTRSKYYGDDITHGKDRAMDLTYCGATGDGIGVWMVYGNRESSAGGPFYRDIQNQYGSSQQEIYNYMFSGHAQWEDWRFNVLNGPYTLVFNNGSAPTYPIDYSWVEGMNLIGFVPDADRGTVSGTATGIQDGFEGVVGFANTNAQYWATVTNGTYASPLMKPGTYSVTLYQQELEVDTDSVTITAGNNATKNLSASTSSTIFWRIGERDGTPAGLLNVDKVIEMHPKDVRMGNWGVATNSASPYVVGGSTPQSEGLACYQWKGFGSQYVQFDLTADQVVNSTIRIGITTSYEGGRPGIEINGYSTYETSYPDDLNSRSMTIGTWRGVNFESSFSVSSRYLHEGSNVLKINAVSGSGWTDPFLSPGMGIDYIEMSGPGSVTPPAPTGLVPARSGNAVEVSWNAVDWAEHYVLERATSVDGAYTTLASNIGPSHFTDSSADSETTYYYRVSSVNSAGTSTTSSTEGVRPETPTGLEATAASATQIDLSWTASTGAESYTIKRARSIPGPYTTVEENVVPTHYSNTGLTKNTTYYYVVSAVNTNGKSGDSSEAHASTLGAVQVASSEGGLAVATRDSTFNGLTTSTFDAGSGNCVVLLMGFSAGEDSVTGVTFAGEAMTLAESAGRSQIWYLIDPETSSGTFQLQASASTAKYIISAMSLSGVDGVSDTASNNQGGFPQSLATSNAVEDGMVLLSSLNWANIDGRCPDYSSGPASNQLYRTYSSSYIAAAQYYGSTALSGTYTNIINATYNNYPPYTVAVAFDAERIPPAAPTNLSASGASSSRIDLFWAKAGEADSYTVKRAAESGGPYTNMATNVVTTNYSDTGLTENTTYYYIVNSVNAGGASTNSAETVATTYSVPAAGNLEIERQDGAGFKVHMDQLMEVCSEPAGLLFGISSVAAASASTHTVTVTDPWIFYSPEQTFEEEDRFSFDITNSVGETAQGWVLITVTTDGTTSLSIETSGGDVTLRLNGIPGRTAVLQGNTNLTTGVWTNLETNSFNTNGLFEFLETNAPSPRYYRLRSHTSD